jgi:hypothetical protein
MLAALAFVASCFFPTRYVYAFGVFALSTLILMLPFVLGALAEVLEGARPRLVRVLATATGDALMAHGGLTVGSEVVVWAGLLAASRMILGSLSDHLYAIPAAAFGAAVTAMVVSLVVCSIPRETRNAQ